METLRQVAHMRFSEYPNFSGVYQDIFKTNDNRLIETAVYTGRDYEDMTFVSITTQIGCPIGCTFCEVSKMSLARNLSEEELKGQVDSVINNINDVKWLKNRPLKISLGRAGEPLLNPSVPKAVDYFANTLSTDIQMFSVLPNAPIVIKNLSSLQNIAATMSGIFQMTVSLHSTREETRRLLMPKGNLMSFSEIATFGKNWTRMISKRRINLSLIMIDGIPFDFINLTKYFSPDIFCVRLAYYLPTSQLMFDRHKPSSDERLAKEVYAATKAGYCVISSPAGPLERIWDTRPFSAFNMLQLHLRPDSKNSSQLY